MLQINMDPRSAWVAAICHHAHQQVWALYPILTLSVSPNPAHTLQQQSPNKQSCRSPCLQPDELAKAVAHCVLSDGGADDVARQGPSRHSPLIRCRVTHGAGIELLRLMACSVCDLGVESIFTRGSASGDWQQRQHPSDLVHPPVQCCHPPAAQDVEGGEAAVDADQRSAASSACDAQARYTAECIAAVTALVLRQKGVDEATIADAVSRHQPRTTVAAAAFTRCRCTAAAPATRSCCCT
jgi:hypothetical protein